MKIEEQVLSREQMAHLVKLGVDASDASMCWTCYGCMPNNGDFIGVRAREVTTLSTPN